MAVNCYPTRRSIGARRHSDDALSDGYELGFALAASTLASSPYIAESAATVGRAVSWSGGKG
jgi:hypothetical protein